LALVTAKSGAKLRRIGRKLGVESAELPAGNPGGRPEIGAFGLFLQINVTVQRISYTVCQHLAQINVTVWRISYSLIKQANNLTSFQTNQMETSRCCLKTSICAPPDHPAVVDA
jgi:hypothetical protein